MGNAADCDYCGNKGKPFSFGCPRCRRYDPSEDWARKDARTEQINANIAHRKMLEEREKNEKA